MSIPVIGWSTGTVGIHAVPAIVAHPQLELVGLWVHSDDKAGRDAGELCGGPAVGVAGMLTYLDLPTYSARASS